MFGLFKKHVPKANPNILAIEIIKISKVSFEAIDEHLNEFFIEFEGLDKFISNKDKIRNEIKWIPYVAGIISVFFNSDSTMSHRVIDEIIHILKSDIHELSSNISIHDVDKKRLESYLNRFICGLEYRDTGKGGYELMHTITQSIFDCAHEGIYYFTNAKRQSLKLNTDSIPKIEERTPWGMLEMHVREELMIYFDIFCKYFEKFDWNE